MRQTQEKSLDKIKLEAGWKSVLKDEFEKPYMLKLKEFLRQELDAGKKIYPKPSDIFNAFNHTPFDQVKVVILGQDPYHGEGQAHGLSFSVKPGVRIPPSLANIYKELHSDLKIPRASHGYLKSWADQGVLLLNATLTVEGEKAGSHQKKGWEEFTDRAIKALSDNREGLVFVLWGAYAQKKGAVIDRNKHHVIECHHPSPLSASRGFLGSQPFSKINAYLRKTGKTEIDWRLPALSDISS
jgi:uracil-DNA glycosylase